MANLSFVIPRSRKYIKVSIAFLCTQVRRLYEDDWGKLVMVIIYIRYTLCLPLIIRAESMSVIKWWVYASFAAHPDCKGHTGAMMSMGLGSIMELLRKKQIDGRSSTEANIVGADNALPQCLWLRYFIEVQRYAVEELEFHQDNINAMLTKKNGK